MRYWLPVVSRTLLSPVLASLLLGDLLLSLLLVVLLYLPSWPPLFRHRLGFAAHRSFVGGLPIFGFSFYFEV